MAFIGNIATPYGINANYHIITSHTWYKTDLIAVVISGYINQSDLGVFQPVINNTYTFTLASNPDLFTVLGNINLVDLYTALSAIEPYTPMIYQADTN